MEQPKELEQAARASAIFVGDQSLLIRCAQRFLEKGHSIKGIVSADPEVRTWAQEMQLPLFEPGGDLAQKLASETFDYLFSVVNLSVLPDEVLELPDKLAVNFHDGPLPEYAGLNVTSWALLNREPRHGVTWHVMTSQVDKGDILKAESFPVASGETALTLNAKCYAAAFRCFDTLLDELVQGRAVPQPQAQGPGRYYARDKRPAAAASLDWEGSAEAAVALAHALDFGPYPNPLGLAKTWLGERPLTVTGLELLPDTSVMPAGTVTHIGEDTVTVATGSFDVSVGGFATLTGEPLTPATLRERYALTEGGRFRTPDDHEAAALSRAHQACAVHEAFWTRRLQQLEPLTLPYARRHSEGQRGEGRRGEGSYQQVQLNPDANVSNDQVAAAFALYLSRIGGKQAFTLQVRPAGLPALVEGAEHAFATRVPLQVKLNPEQSFADVADYFEKQLKTIEKRGTYLLDLLQRTPELGDAARHWHEDVPSVALDFTDSPAPADLALVLTGEGWQWRYRDDVYDATTVARMQQQFEILLASVNQVDKLVSQLPLVPKDEVQRLETWNATQTDYDRGATLHRLFEAQVARTPDAVALVCQGEQLSYADLNTQSNQVAHLLLSRGVKAGSLVGVLVERSNLMLSALLGCLKAGCAYVPLDPSYPKERLSYMVEDAQVAAVLTQQRFETLLGTPQSLMLPLDSLQGELQTQPSSNPVPSTQPSDLAYVIYTSGSTGQPKGVMVEHGNVVNFFAGMDARLGGEADRQPGEQATWLAVTSISFDISVLELFWTLARGFKVVLYTGEDKQVAAVQKYNDKPLDFSLFYFSSDEGEQAQEKYKLLLDGAKFADEHGFTAVWTPERHFHAFGGLYPNPAVTSAALATATKRVQLRSGSCVLPLHHPARIAEDWAVVDNLSGGRVGISFASGWQPDDFALMPQNFAERHQVFYEGIEQVRRLWRGETLSFPGPKGEVEVRTLPRPVQDELPFWVTAAGNPETFRKAGELGANLLTHLLGQTAEELTDKIEIYRTARQQAGREGPGTVSLMLHSFVAEDEQTVRQQVQEPLKAYLRSSANLIKQYASAFPAFKNVAKNGQLDDAFQKISATEMEALLEFSFERYYATSGLFGTPESCLERVEALKNKGIDEIACLIDFGVPTDTVLAHLPYLDDVRARANAKRTNPQAQNIQAQPLDASIPALVRRHGVTHLQCTPSLANMLYSDSSGHDALASLTCMMVGGEAFPTDLAAGLSELVGNVTNMYGPTETTIWSATHKLGEVQAQVPIGTPIANTQVYILDEQLEPLPIGVPGELVIGGAGVVRGYLNRAELTAERFVPDPFSSDPQARLYRTGDLARWNNGVLEFLGRLDHQVKIRGHRIELGEIEVALGEQEGVAQAVVVAREDTPGNQQLVAYVVSEPGHAVQEGAVLEPLKKRLPEFMLPAAVVTLDAFPLTPNKKVDRKALPAPEVKRPVAAYTPPKNDLETVIAEVWKQVLNVPTIGVQDNFFDSGGHSLLVVQTLTLLRKRLDIPLQMTDLFRFPTVTALAGHLSRGPVQQVSRVKETAPKSAGRNRAAARKAARRRATTQEPR